MVSTQSLADAYLQSPAAHARNGILIVDDHELVRLGLRALVHSRFAARDRPLQIFETRSLAGALEVYALNQSDIAVVFLDLGLPDAHGLTGLARFREAQPDARIVVLSGDTAPATQREALALGADAYLQKSADLKDVIDYIESRDVLRAGPPRAVPPAATPPPASGLTPRQMQILGLVLEGRSNREIGDITCLAEGTVKNHVSTILLHFGARSRSQLISSLK